MSTAGWQRLGRPPRVASVGVYIADVLGRVIEDLPQGQRSRLVDEIALTVAGTAGAVAVNLSRLGADVSAVGVVGRDDFGAYIRGRLDQEGVDTTHLRTVDDVQTSATILAIDSKGQRPAFHVIGASRALGRDDTERISFGDFDVLHLGGVTAMPGLDGNASIDLLTDAHRSGLFVTMDVLGIKRDDAAELVAGYLPYVDLFTPNDAEAIALTGASSAMAAAVRLVEFGVQTAVVTCGGDGAIVCDADGPRHLPAQPTDVVDTTGCGDALTSGVIVGLFLGLPTDDAVGLGMTAASLTAEGLGSAAGITDLTHLLSESARRLELRIGG